MSWSAFTWTEIQAKAPHLPDRYLYAATRTSGLAFEAVSLTVEFLKPFAAIEAALGLWRLGSDLGWTGAFVVNSGIFSHWQVWFAVSAFTQIVAVYLNRRLSGQPGSVENQP